ncbi:M50 family metallopeptidase [Virgibacillus oceani]|uniref:Stage IV sporulation protein FB n=1 Tax=Virgibacillus oceani TaxID=1479511 RepID=A0A917LWS0_9BACI|nr:M50 family metallopeptidase [Virgibacillus oceani]GGG62516.1 stage IV sporulation protein FB [Virgibacillus oceani]
MTILHKIVPTIHIHPILLLFIGIAFITGTFVELFVILSIVLIHELGHYVMAHFFKWRVRSIMLWIFGGVMDTDEHGNRPFHEEALVTIAGPFQHIAIYGLLLFFSNAEIFPPSILEIMFFYNTVIFLFNLLPVWPLDGGKLLFLSLSAIFPYRKAYHSVILISLAACLIIILLQLFVLPFTLSSVVLMLFLLKENRVEWKQRYYVFIRFLLKRYQNRNLRINGVRPIVVPHQSSLIEVFEHFRREKKHPIYIIYPDDERKAIDENDCLRSYFYDKQYSKTIGEIARSIY